MSRRRKISVIAILGLGVSASITTCIRMPYLKYYDVVNIQMRSLVRLDTLLFLGL